MNPRVCMLTWDYWPFKEGGAERQCRKLTARLVEDGISCRVVTRWPGFSVPRSQRDGEVEIRRFGSFAPILNGARSCRECVAQGNRAEPSPASLAQSSGDARSRRFRLMAPFQMAYHASFMTEVAIWLRTVRRDVDILHVHGSHWIAGFGAWLGHRHGIPVICKEASFPAFDYAGTDVPLMNRWLQWRPKAFYQAQTPMVATDLVEKGVPDNRVVVIPNGVEIPPRAVPVEENTGVLYVGNLYQLNEWKAFDVLFEAWAQVHRRKPALRLVVAGGGDPEPWRRFLAERDAADSVDFIGFVEDPAKLYEQASMILLPSRKEGMSNALLEAQSWGVPAVVSDIPANRFLIEDGYNGLITPVSNADAFADAVLRLVDDPGERSRMGRAAREHMRNHFSMEQVAIRLMEVYRSMLSKSHSAPEGKS